MASGTADIRVMTEVQQRGLGPLVGDVFRRFRDAYGMSHARALGYQGTFALISGFIGLVGLASVLGDASIRGTIVEISKTIAPGPSSQLLQEAASQSTGGGTAAVVGLGAALISGALAMAQIERSANRLSGRTQDRAGLRRFVVAVLLALSAGVLAAVGLLIIAGGHAIATGFGWKGAVADAWNVLRWIVGIASAAVGIYLLFQWAPERPLGRRGAVVAGAVVTLVLWVLFTVALAVWFSASSSAQTYGPLVSVVALLLWAGATSLALHLGMALTAELTARSPAKAKAAGDVDAGGDSGYVRVPSVERDRS